MAKTNLGKQLSPLKSIKAYCKYHRCVNDRGSLVNCSLTNCFLYRYRLGKTGRTLKQKDSSKGHNSEKEGIIGGSKT